MRKNQARKAAPEETTIIQSSVETAAEMAPAIAPSVPKAPKAVKAKDPFSDGFDKGFACGFDKGKELYYESAFADGVRHIVSLAENFLVKELKLPSRDALVDSGKIPAWWMCALVTNLTDGRGEKKGGKHQD